MAENAVDDLRRRLNNVGRARHRPCGQPPSSFMRQIGTLDDGKQAKRFTDYLLTRGIRAQVDSGADGSVIWVRDEDQLDQARGELDKFRAAPDDPRYLVGHEADRIRAEADSYSKRFQRNQIDVRRRWIGGMASRRGPLTLALVGISVAVTLMSNFGKLDSPITRACVITTQGLVPQLHPDQGELPEIRQGQIWRLVTPIFLHLSTLHIIFNMLWLLDLGNLIEARRGPLRFCALVVAIAVASNLTQFAFGGPGFGGMSGVVFGLFGYVWMKARFDPGSGFFLTQNTVFWMIAWLVFCFTGWAGPVANAAHATGLVAGVVIGILPRRR